MKIYIQADLTTLWGRKLMRDALDHLDELEDCGLGGCDDIRFVPAVAPPTAAAPVSRTPQPAPGLPAELARERKAVAAKIEHVDALMSEYEHLEAVAEILLSRDTLPPRTPQTRQPAPTVETGRIPECMQSGPDGTLEPLPREGEEPIGPPRDPDPAPEPVAEPAEPELPADFRRAPTGPGAGANLQDVVSRPQATVVDQQDVVARRPGPAPAQIPEIQHAAPPADMPDASSAITAVEALPDPSEAVTPTHPSLPGAAEDGSIHNAVPSRKGMNGAAAKLRAEAKYGTPLEPLPGRKGLNPKRGLSNEDRAAIWRMYSEGQPPTQIGRALVRDVKQVSNYIVNVRAGRSAVPA